MFGYISINKAEMKFKDYDVYHSMQSLKRMLW